MTGGHNRRQSGTSRPGFVELAEDLEDIEQGEGRSPRGRGQRDPPTIGKPQPARQRERDDHGERDRRRGLDVDAEHGLLALPGLVVALLRLLGLLAGALGLGRLAGTLGLLDGDWFATAPLALGRDPDGKQCCGGNEERRCDPTSGQAPDAGDCSFAPTATFIGGGTLAVPRRCATLVCHAGPVTRTLAPPPPARRRPSARRTTSRQWVALLFLGALLYQGFHQVEHTIETVQLRLLGHATARTLIGGLDFEWVHLGANVFLLWCLIAVAVGAGTDTRDRWRSNAVVGWWGLCAALTVQGYHVVEHLVRIVQYLVTGEDPRGTVTTVLDPVWFHFGVNLTVLVGMAVAFFGLGVHRNVLGRAPRR